MKKLAVITVDYNSHPDTLEFVESFKKLNHSNLDIKLIVVDNGSKTPLEIDTTDLIQTGENLGFAGGYNRGIKYAKQWGADYYLIINNDVLFPDKNLLEKLLKVFDIDSNIGVVTSKILFAPGFEYHKSDYKKEDSGKVIWYAGGHFDWANVQTVHRGLDQVDTGQYDHIEEIGFASGCCLMIKKEVIDNVGLFDEQLFTYFEDSDFATRIKKAGFSQYYCGQTYIWHKVSRSAGIGSPVTDYLTTRNRLVFGFRNASWKTKFALARESLRLLLSGRKGQRQGIWDFLNGKLGRPSFLNTESSNVFPLSLSIVIINYKTPELTMSLLKSIFNKNSGFDNNTMEVILIDNASFDGIKELVEKAYPQVKFIGNEVNKGFSGGNNQGIDYSRGENVLLLNSDIEVKQNALSEMIKATKIYPGSVLAGKLFFPDGSLQDSVFNLPTAWGAFKEYFLGQKGNYFMYTPAGNKPSHVECAVMACYLIPWTVINQVGKLDEGTFMYFEDVEYSRRLKILKIPIYFIPSAEFIHHHGASSKKIGADKSYQLLKKGSLHYHGIANYALLWMILWFGQRLNQNITPKSRWKS
jgi:GT2 family glycosyltransferase